jgi:hypothetical protein
MITTMTGACPNCCTTNTTPTAISDDEWHRKELGDVVNDLKAVHFGKHDGFVCTRLL